MSKISIEGIDLIKPMRASPDNSISEVRSVYALQVICRRNIIELDIPGSAGAHLQDLGSDPVHVSIFGEMIGEVSKDILGDLFAKFSRGEPVKFISELTQSAEIERMLMKEFFFEENEGSENKYNYNIVLVADENVL